MTVVEAQHQGMAVNGMGFAFEPFETAVRFCQWADDFHSDGRVAHVNIAHRLVERVIGGALRCDGGYPVGESVG